MTEPNGNDTPSPLRIPLPVLQDQPLEPPAAPRTEFGVARSTCACPLCRFCCKVLPGMLLPADLGRLIPAGADPRAWAREHLRATPRGTLVPARATPGGPCHWLTADDRCAVHAASPFGCALFYCDQPKAEVERLKDQAITAICEAHSQGGLYAELHQCLWDEGLRDYGSEAGKAALRAFAARQKGRAERARARAHKKVVRARRKKPAR